MADSAQEENDPCYVVRGPAPTKVTLCPIPILTAARQDSGLRRVTNPHGGGQIKTQNFPLQWFFVRGAQPVCRERSEARVVGFRPSVLFLLQDEAVKHYLQRDPYTYKFKN